jgi:osmotically-inducible protein OsmY
MILSRTLLNAAFVAMLSISAVACNSTSTSESAGEYVDDTVISSKVRAQIIGDKDLKLSQIDVETYKGIVQLSGFVDTIQTKWHAGSVAGSVRGVRQVANNLIVK